MVSRQRSFFSVDNTRSSSGGGGSWIYFPAPEAFPKEEVARWLENFSTVLPANKQILRLIMFSSGRAYKYPVRKGKYEKKKKDKK